MEKKMTRFVSAIVFFAVLAAALAPAAYTVTAII